MIYAILAGLPALEAPLAAALPNGGWGEVVYRNEDGRERSPCRLCLKRYAKHHSLNSTMSLENSILLCIRIRTLVLLNGGRNGYDFSPPPGLTAF